MRFSQRVGARAAPTSGLEEATPRLRTALWNELHESLFPTGGHDGQSISRRWNRSTHHAKLIWSHLDLRADQAPQGGGSGRKELGAYWAALEWPEFFDLVEFAAALVAPAGNEAAERKKWYSSLNAVLEREGCAYRFIGEKLAPLTNPTELGEVGKAAESAIPSVAAHIRAALAFLPPNAEVSARNSVKESISAVEAAVKQLAGKAGATLAKGLAAFEAKHGPMHPALRAGLLNLYGYTSDEGGVRHALIDEAAEVTLDDARFMVVICSAFANYLVALSGGGSE